MIDEDDRGDWEHDVAKDKELDRRWEEQVPFSFLSPEVRRLTLELSRCAALMDITAATLNVLQASDKNTANLAHLIDNLLDARDDANKAIKEAMIDKDGQ